MVNLRYHLVSIIAVFLALGLGVLFGSTVVDRGTVAFLEDRLDEVEADVDRTEERNRELSQELEELRRRETALAEEGTGRLLAGQLRGMPVVVVRLAGGDAADGDVRTTLVDAGAALDAVVTLGNDLALTTDSQRERFVEALGLRPGLADMPDRIRAVAARRVAGALWWPAFPPLAAARDEEPLAAARDLAALAQAGFLTVDRLGEAGEGAIPLPAGPDVGLVVVAPPDRPLSEAETVILDLLERIHVTEPAPTTVVATPGEGAQGPVALLREEAELVPGVSTVDHVNSFAGRLALVLALRDGELGAEAGHYGSGPESQRLVPAAPG